MFYSRRQFLGWSAACFGIAILAGPRAFAEKTPSFAFAAINDIHASRDGDISLLRKAVQMINNDAAIEFVAVLGDMASTAAPEEMDIALEGLRKLKAPWHAIPGNHDVDPKDRRNPYGAYEHVFGDRQWTWPLGGWVFIGLDTCNGNASDVTVPKERMEWLRETVAAIPARTPIALLTHHPLNPHTKQYLVKNRDEIIEMFKDHNLKLVASGHYHGNQEEEAGGVLYVTTACCAVHRDNADGTVPKGFRRFEVSGETIKHQFVAVNTGTFVRVPAGMGTGVAV
jgi:hypothetical protein